VAQSWSQQRRRRAVLSGTRIFAGRERIWGCPQGTQAAEDREVEGVCKAQGNTECEPGDGLAGLVGIDAAGAEPVRLATAWLASREMTRQVRSECACRGS